MTQCYYFTGPVRRTATGVHTNETGFTPGEEWQQLRSFQRPVADDLFIFRNSVNLIAFLGNFLADYCGNQLPVIGSRPIL